MRALAHRPTDRVSTHRDMPRCACITVMTVLGATLAGVNANDDSRWRPTGETTKHAARPSKLPEVNVSSSGSQLVIHGDVGSSSGIFDPSLYVGSGAVAVAYSSVANTSDIHTRVATRDPNGDWSLVADVNAAKIDVTIPCGAAGYNGTCSGNVVHEVPSLVYEGDDPDPSRRWKVFTHTYLVGDNPPNKLWYQYGHISLYTAPTASGPWSVEQSLLGWVSDSPFSLEGVPAAGNLSSVPDLSDCLAFTEPAALAGRPRQAGHNSTSSLYLSLGCIYVREPAPGKLVFNIRVVVLRSADHGKTFNYVDAIVTGCDATNLGFDSPTLNAADLFEGPDGDLFISVSPEGPVPIVGVGYAGCLILKIDELTSTEATVQRDDKGVPIVQQYLVPTTARFSGACTYHAQAATPTFGYLMPMLFVDSSPASPFRIVTSGVQPPDA